MKAETQANALATLVQKKKPYTQYELILPPFQLKQSMLEKLVVGDVLLLELDALILLLLNSNNVCARAKVVNESNTHKLKIVNLKEDMLEELYIKKYENVKCSFGMLQSIKLEVGNTMSIEDINLKKVILFVKEKNVAEAILIKINNKIAIEIKKVNHV